MKRCLGMIQEEFIFKMLKMFSRIKRIIARAIMSHIIIKIIQRETLRLNKEIGETISVKVRKNHREINIGVYVEMLNGDFSEDWHLANIDKRYNLWYDEFRDFIEALMNMYPEGVIELWAVEGRS